MTSLWRLSVRLLLCLTFSLAGVAQAQTIVFYNVENLFHPDNDSLRADDDFTPEGKYRWSKRRYYQKLHQIARVLTCSDNQYPTLVGLAEVENAQCLNDLCRHMPQAPYRFIHFDGPDRRGIDVALLYDSLHFHPDTAIQIPIYLDSATTTRDILYVRGTFMDKLINPSTNKLLNLYICHLPSQLGGAAASAWKRERAKTALQKHYTSILARDSAANIIVMGDMNAAPQNDLPKLINLSTVKPINQSTHKHNGIWTCLDQFYLTPYTLHHPPVIFSPSWLLEYDRKYLGYRPKRTFNGFRYNKNGFSDHLPILLKLQ